MRVYAIGDIHGQLEMLQVAHGLVAEDRIRCSDSTAPVVHLGDYCDRGPDSAGVLQFLIDGMARGEPWRAVLGNHDRMFRVFLDDPHAADPRLRSELNWLSSNLGGRETLRSYGVGQADVLPAEQLHAVATRRVSPSHRQFLAMLETNITLGELFFAHAGIRPGIPLNEQTEDDLIWIRHEFLDDQRDHGKLIVHGHTPVKEPTHYGNRVNLDSGAGYFRPLTVAVFEGRDCWALTEEGRRPLLPEL